MIRLIKRLTSVALLCLLLGAQTLAGEGSPAPSAPPPPPDDPIVFGPTGGNTPDVGETDMGELYAGELTLGEIIELLLSVYSVRLL